MIESQDRLPFQPFYIILKKRSIMILRDGRVAPTSIARFPPQISVGLASHIIVQSAEVPCLL